VPTEDCTNAGRKRTGGGATDGIAHCFKFATKGNRASMLQLIQCSKRRVDREGCHQRQLMLSRPCRRSAERIAESSIDELKPFSSCPCSCAIAVRASIAGVAEVGGGGGAAHAPVNCQVPGAGTAAVATREAYLEIRIAVCSKKGVDLETASHDARIQQQLSACLGASGNNAPSFRRGR